jgi:hypothetical protein
MSRKKGLSKKRSKDKYIYFRLFGAKEATFHFAVSYPDANFWGKPFVQLSKSTTTHAPAKFWVLVAASVLQAFA